MVLKCGRELILQSAEFWFPSGNQPGLVKAMNCGKLSFAQGNAQGQFNEKGQWTFGCAAGAESKMLRALESQAGLWEEKDSPTNISCHFHLSISMEWKGTPGSAAQSFLLFLSVLCSRSIWATSLWCCDCAEIMGMSTFSIAGSSSQPSWTFFCYPTASTARRFP